MSSTNFGSTTSHLCKLRSVGSCNILYIYGFELLIGRGPIIVSGIRVLPQKTIVKPLSLNCCIFQLQLVHLV